MNTQIPLQRYALEVLSWKITAKELRLGNVTSGRCLVDGCGRVFQARYSGQYGRELVKVGGGVLGAVCRDHAIALRAAML